MKITSLSLLLKYQHFSLVITEGGTEENQIFRFDYNINNEIRKGMYNVVLIILLSIFSKGLMGQNSLNWLDSLGNKVGYWEECEYVDFFGEMEIDDTICVKGLYKNGYKDSLWVLNSKRTGVTRMTVEYKDSMRIAYSEFDEKGNKIVYHYSNPFNQKVNIVFYYSNGKVEDSLYEDSTIRFKIAYHQNGSIREGYQVFDSIFNYKKNIYWDNGRLRKVINYQHNGDMQGVKHGNVKTYHLNGTLHEDCNYHKGVLDKLYIEYDEEGKAISFKYYSQGIVVYTGGSALPPCQMKNKEE